MNLVRSLFVLATSIAVSGFVQAESASLYMKIRKSLPVKLQQNVTAQQSAFQPIAQLTVTPQGQLTTELAAKPTALNANQMAAEAAAAAAAEMQPHDTILPKGSRVVAGDETKDEFYILTENESDPVRHLPAAVVEKQLQRMDAPRLLWAFNQLPRVDVILSQIAHKVVGSEPAPQRASAVTSAAKPLPRAEKNGDIADIEVALDKTFAESYKQVVKPVYQSEKISLQQYKTIRIDAKPQAANIKPQHKVIKDKAVADSKVQHKLVKNKVTADVKSQHKPAKHKAIVDAKSQHKPVKEKVVAAKAQHKPVKEKAVAAKAQHKPAKAKTIAVKRSIKHVKDKVVADDKPLHKPIKDKPIAAIKSKHHLSKLALSKKVSTHTVTASSTQNKHFWRVEKSPAHHQSLAANRKHVPIIASRHVTAHANS